MTKVQTIMLENNIIEIHYNTNLKSNPYLIRIFSYNNNYPNELRLNETEIQDLYNILKRYKHI
jgi:hypothetical protein